MHALRRARACPASLSVRSGPVSLVTVTVTVRRALPRADSESQAPPDSDSELRRPARPGAPSARATWGAAAGLPVTEWQNAARPGGLRCFVNEGHDAPGVTVSSPRRRVFLSSEDRPVPGSERLGLSYYGPKQPLIDVLKKIILR